MTILIVDDEQIAIDGIKAASDFPGWGIEHICSANSMLQAQDIMREEKVDILLCDVEMPGGSGLELIEWINREYPSCINIILTNYSDFSFAKKAVSLSCFEYVLKPATPDVLADVIPRAVERAKQNAEEAAMKSFGQDYVNQIAGEEARELDAAESARRFIREHPEEELSVERIAAEVFLTPGYLTKIFKKRYGKTVSEYITDTRMEIAENLLRSTDLSIMQIASKVGYANYPYFIRSFGKYAGCSPREFRKREENRKQ